MSYGPFDHAYCDPSVDVYYDPFDHVIHAPYLPWSTKHVDELWVYALCAVIEDAFRCVKMRLQNQIDRSTLLQFDNVLVVAQQLRHKSPQRQYETHLQIQVAQADHPH